MTFDFSWLGHNLRDAKMVFDVQPNPDDWLVLGKKKGYFIATVRNRPSHRYGAD